MSTASLSTSLSKDELRRLPKGSLSGPGSDLATRHVDLEFDPAKKVETIDQLDGFAIEWEDSIPELTVVNAGAAGILFRHCRWQPSDVYALKVERIDGTPTIYIPALQLPLDASLRVFVVLRFEPKIWDAFEAETLTAMGLPDDETVDIRSILIANKKLSTAIGNCCSVRRASYESSDALTCHEPHYPCL